MNILLNPQNAAFVQKQMQDHQYDSTDDLINQAVTLLRLLKERQAQSEETIRQIEVGTAQINAGQVTDGDTVFDRLRNRLKNG